MNRLALAGLLICLLAAAGCRGAKSEKTYDVTSDKLTVADLPPARSIVIDFESKDNIPITAVLVKTEEATALLDAVASSKKTPEQAIAGAKTMAMQTGVRGTLTPPETDSKVPYSVLLLSKKPTSVTVRTKGR